MKNASSRSVGASKKKSIRKRKEKTYNAVDIAQVGPRQLKDKESFEYAVQTLVYIKTIWKSKVDGERRWLDALKQAEEVKIWEKLGFVSEDAMLLDEIGYTKEQSIKQFEEWREQGPLADHGNQEGERNSRNRDNHVMSVQGNASTYLARRLLRDRPDLFERLEAGEFSSVRQAALEAGIVKPTFTCPIDPERAANLILKHFELKNVKTLIQLLNSGISNRKT